MASTHAGLSRLPLELSGAIFGRLNDQAICNLRLTCRSLQIATSWRFLKVFAHLTTDLSSKSIEGLLFVCKHPHFSSAIQSLTIVAKYYDTEFLQKVLESKQPYEVCKYGQWGPELRQSHRISSEAELKEAKAHVDILAQRKNDQTNIVHNKSDLEMLTTLLQKSTKMRSLTLETGVYHYPETRLTADEARDAWSKVWERATYVYTVTMTAVAQSRSSVNELNIYGGKWGCSVPGYDLNEAMPSLKANGIDAALANLRTLSLNCSTRLIKPPSAFASHEAPRYPIQPTESNQELVALATDRRNYLGQAQLLSLCPNLEELELVHYFLRAPRWGSQEDISTYCSGHAAIFDHIVQSVQLPRLLKCTIRGHEISQAAILKFLNGSPMLKHLDLRFVNFAGSGTWDLVMDQCKNLDILSLRRVFENRRVLYFGNSSGWCGSSTLSATNDQLRSGVRYQVQEYEMGSIEAHNYREEMRRDHGPPKGYY